MFPLLLHCGLDRTFTTNGQRSTTETAIDPHDDLRHAKSSIAPIEYCMSTAKDTCSRDGERIFQGRRASKLYGVSDLSRTSLQMINRENRNDQIQREQVPLYHVEQARHRKEASIGAQQGE